MRRRIEPRGQALRRRLLIAGRAVDLAGEEQARDVARLQRRAQPARIDELIFDRIAGPDDLDALQARDAAHEVALNVGRQRGRNAVGIDERIVEPLGLEEDLVAVAVGEALHLVLDRRAIARPPALDRAGEQRRAVEVRADDVVRALVGPGDRAARAAARERRRRARTSSSRRDRSAAPRAAPSRSCGRRAAAACRSSAAPGPGRSRGPARPSATDARSPRRPPSMHLLADEDARVEEGAGRDHQRAALEQAQRRSRRPATRPPSIRSASASATTSSTPLSASSSAIAAR